MSEISWESRYGEVVWSKFGSFPWWPSCILDPKKVLSRDACKGQAVSSTGKTYTVYFYGDGTLGFITPSNLKPFNEENTNKFRNQKLPKAYLTLFPEAIARANAEILLEKEQRLAWYRDDDIEGGTSDADEAEGEAEGEEEGDEVAEDKKVNKDESKEEEKADSAPASPVKRKRGRPPSSSSGNKNKTKKRLKKNSSSTKEGGESEDDLLNEEEPEEKQASEDELYDVEEEEEEVVHDEEEAASESEHSEAPKSKGRRGRPPGSTNKPKTPNETPSATNDVSTSTQKKRGRPRKSDVKDTAVTTVAKPKKETVTPAKSLKNQFDEESREDRLQRLHEILKLTTERDSLDESRALKTIDKLKGMSLTLDELKSTGVGKFMNVLSKTHSNARIKEAANTLVTSWRSMMSAANGNKEKADSTQTTGSTSETPRLTTTTSLKSPKAVSIEDVMSEEVKNDVERSRAVLLLNSVINDPKLTVDLEKAIFAAFHPSKEEKEEVINKRKNVIYFESITRFYAQLRSLQSIEEVKSSIQQLLSNENEKGAADDNNNSSFAIRNQFSYIATY